MEQGRESFGLRGGEENFVSGSRPARSGWFYPERLGDDGLLMAVKDKPASII